MEERSESVGQNIVIFKFDEDGTVMKDREKILQTNFSILGESFGNNYVKIHKINTKWNATMWRKITDNENSIKEIISTITQTNAVFNTKQELLISRNVKVETRKNYEKFIQ